MDSPIRVYPRTQNVCMVVIRELIGALFDLNIREVSGTGG